MLGRRVVTRERCDLAAVVADIGRRLGSAPRARGLGSRVVLDWIITGRVARLWPLRHVRGEKRGGLRRPLLLRGIERRRVGLLQQLLRRGVPGIAQGVSLGVLGLKGRLVIPQRRHLLLPDLVSAARALSSLNVC